VNGYWDYPFANRGLAFAPVWFNRPLWSRPGWFYRPWYALNTSDLFFSLFVGPHRHHYFFGDYFGANYARQGFWPWYSWGRNFHDPFFEHQRWEHRGDRNWYANLRNDYWGRRNGDVARPPHTVGFRDFNGIRPAGNAAHLVTPLNRLPAGQAGLNRVSPAQQRQFQPANQRFQATSQQRNQTELRTARPVTSGAARQSFYSAPKINSGGVACNAGQFRELSSVHQTAPRGFQAPAAHHAAPAYRGSSHAMPSHARSAPSFHSGASFHGGGGGGSHGHKH